MFALRVYDKSNDGHYTSLYATEKGIDLPDADIIYIAAPLTQLHGRHYCLWRNKYYVVWIQRYAHAMRLDDIYYRIKLEKECRKKRKKQKK